MLLLRTHESATRVNANHVAVFYVRKFSDDDGTGRAGVVVTASVVYPTRDQKYRLTPRLSPAAADAALADLERILVSDATGSVRWEDGGWTVDPGLG